MAKTIRQTIIDFVTAWLETASLDEIARVFDQEILNNGAKAKARQEVKASAQQEMAEPEPKPVIEKKIIRRPRVIKHPRRKVNSSDRDQITSGLKGLKVGSKEYKAAVTKLCKKLGLSRRQVAMAYAYRDGLPGTKKAAKKFKVEKVSK